ncbi:MAG: NAD(P)/FAD-dependent oxidoreductase [Candidatus Omnitrophica bacterium]|nr:NAD(P)/FAD-dependent oxidoreductase [Candidatus Omnitrophota bacterium]
MGVYDIAVVGAGPAGMIAAIRAGQLKKKVVLLERNDVLGKKILLTGKGRCNVTNIASLDAFIERFGKQGVFLRSAFLAFFNQDLIDFLNKKGLQLKIERQGRVFPITYRAYSIVKILKEYLVENKVEVLYKMRLLDIKRKADCFQLHFGSKGKINAKKVILSTGGASYKITGSTGDGFQIARSLGHAIVPLSPALVPLRTGELWSKKLQGLSLRNIRITFEYDKKKIVSDLGEFMFTHFGVSGPIVLDLSANVISKLKEHKQIRLFIDLKPGLSHGQLEDRLLKEFKSQGKVQLKNIMKGLLPHKLIPIFICLLSLNPETRANQITQRQRSSMISLLKALPLTITGSLPIEEAMVTGGGISTREINPRTMESKIIPGLYFAGEIIDGCASSGGYNLQQAFSTGYLAGEKAAYA